MYDVAEKFRLVEIIMKNDLCQFPSYTIIIRESWRINDTIEKKTLLRAYVCWILQKKSLLHVCRLIHYYALSWPLHFLCRLYNLLFCKWDIRLVTSKSHIKQYSPNCHEHFYYQVHYRHVMRSNWKYKMFGFKLRDFSDNHCIR